MYCLGYDDIYPVFETITLKVFNAQNNLHRKELISGVFDRVLVTPYFNGISKFNEYGYYTMGGRSKKGKLTIPYGCNSGKKSPIANLYEVKLSLRDLRGSKSEG